MVTREEEGWGRDNSGKEMNCSVIDNNETFGGDHFVVYIDAKL